MTPYARKPVINIVILFLMSMLACKVPQTTTSTPTNLPITQAVIPSSTATVANPTPATTLVPVSQPTTLPGMAEHRIATHRVYGIAGFYDRETKTSFIPRGTNYSIFVPISDHYEDRVFGVGVYDHERTLADFKALEKAGYNTVRISLDGCSSGDGCIGLENGEGLNPTYLDNVADLMKLAKETGLFLLFASQDLPELGGYKALANQEAGQAFSAGRNTEVLTTAGVTAAQQYWSDILAGLITREAPLEIVLGWEILSEGYLNPDQAPFIQKNRKVTPANGIAYDMSDEAQKQALGVDGLRYYIDQLRKTILSLDPSALVTMGFFAPDTPNPWRVEDRRYVDTTSLLEESSLDFFDFHAYPGMGLSMTEIAQNFGLEGHISKPILMGETGANTWFYPELSSAAIITQDWIAASCSKGFSGWLYKGYYPSPAGWWDATWGMVDEGNILLNAIAPRNQPDACLTTVLPGRNLALGKPVSASASLPDQTPQMAVDGDTNTQWSAGAFPAQWIEIDLGASYSIGEIRLTVGMWPAGEVQHQLWAGTTRDQMQKITEFSGEEFDFDVVNFVPPTPLKNVRYVRVDTSESPSWVSWREIEVLAPFPSSGISVPEITPTP